MKAYRGDDGKIRLFRPDRNMARLLKTAARSSLPTFEADEMIDCIKHLIQIDRDWVPKSSTSSLYIRPTLIGTEVALQLFDTACRVLIINYCLFSDSLRLQASLGVASPNNALLYVVLCPVGPYFPSGFKPVSLLADPKYVRAWPGGCGESKMGANYAPTIQVQVNRFYIRFPCS